MAKRKRSQQSERRHMIFFDQHNRQYSAWIENMTGDPCTPLMPLFAAPVMPPEVYITPRVELGPRRVWIDYARWFADAKQQWKDRAVAAIRFAKELHGNSSAKIDPKNPPADIGHRLGRPPIHLELIAAAAQGNPWVLGFTPQEDVRLVHLLPVEELAKDHVDMDALDFGSLVTEAGERMSPVPTFDLGELAALAEGSFSTDSLMVIDRDAPDPHRPFQPSASADEFFGSLDAERVGELLDGSEDDFDTALDEISDPLADEADGGVAVATKTRKRKG